MAEALGLFALGLLALALGGDSIVKGASGLAQHFGMRPFVAGLLLVAFGTSVPELAVNLRAMYLGQPHLALGNAVGSNIVNLGLTLGVAALVAPLLLRARMLVPLLVLLAVASLALIVFGLDGYIGRVEGGIKANVIAPAAELRFNFRPLPSMDNDALLATFAGFAEPAAAHFEETFRGPSLPSGDIARAEERRLAARDIADELGLPIGNAVDFWTEASLFSTGGYTAFVYGPGDIAQAHTADEFVTLEQLQRYAESVNRIINAGA